MAAARRKRAKETQPRKYTTATRTCLGCSAVITYSPGRGRPPKYCDYKCRDIVYGKRQSRQGTIRPKSLKTPGQRDRERRQHQRALSLQLKLERGHCADCHMEINERTAIVIEWDHVDKTTKSFTISYEMGRKNDQEIIDEIAKCDAVCANCHRYRTHDRQDWKHDFNTPTENTDCPLFD